MILVGAAASLGIVKAEFPAEVKTALQIVIGAFLGYSLDRAAVRRIRTMVRPIALATVWVIGSALLIGYVLALVTKIDLTTAFLGTSPGGIAEMSAMAMSSQANVALVATLQAFRIITTNLLIPFFARGFGAKASGCCTPTSRMMDDPLTMRYSFSFLIWFALGGLGSWLFSRLQIPAAGVIGSMVIVAVVRVMGVNIDRPAKSLRTLAQIGLGILIGATFDAHVLQLLRDESLVVILATLATVVSSLGLAGIVQRVAHIDVQTALLACAPAGLLQMGVIADELGALVFVVNIFQLARLICAVLVLPLLFHMLA